MLAAQREKGGRQSRPVRARTVTCSSLLLTLRAKVFKPRERDLRGAAAV
jgi:hypothetical protein